MPRASQIALCGGLMAFLYQFENCLTATALPVMSRAVPGLAGVVSLVPAAYLVAATVAMVPAGRLALRVGFSKALVVALGLMAAGTMVCGLATDARVLIGGRWLQGLGGGAMASVAYGLVAVGVSPEERRGVLGWVSLGAGLGMVAGTPLGGFVAQVFSWRVLFALQIPLLALAALVVLRAGFSERSGSAAPPCWLRSFVLGLGAAGLCIAGSLGRERGWLSPEILGLQFLALGIFALFVVSERRSLAPLFPREIWRAKSFWPCWGLLFACAAALGGTFFLVPFYLHEVAGFTVAAAAGWMVVLVAGYSFTAMQAGRLQKIFAAESQAFLGSVLTLAGVSLFAGGLVSESNPAAVFAGCALTGCGFGLVFPATNAACVGRLPEGQRGFGAALLPLGLNLGSIVGVILCAELREWHLDERQDYAPAFWGVVVALAAAGGGFLWLWRRGRAA